MSTRYSASIRIGGTLSETDLPAFHEAVEAQFVGLEPGHSPPPFELLCEVVADEGGVDLWGEELRWGRMDRLETFCREHGLAYDLTSDEEMCWWRPGMEAPRRVAALEGEVMLPVGMVRAHLTAPKGSAEERLAALEAALDERTPPPLAPLTVTPVRRGHAPSR